MTVATAVYTLKPVGQLVYTLPIRRVYTQPTAARVYSADRHGAFTHNGMQLHQKMGQKTPGALHQNEHSNRNVLELRQKAKMDPRRDHLPNL